MEVFGHNPPYMKLTVRSIAARFACVLAVVLLHLPIVLWEGSTPAIAQERWAQPLNVSQSIGTSLWPWLVADNSGAVHLFWVDDIGGEHEEGRPRGGNTIMYRRWKDDVWSEQRDILVSPAGDYAAAPVAAIDSLGNLHVVWSSNSGIYYSKADSRFAENPHSWRTASRLALRGPSDVYPAAIAIDHDDRIHVIIASPEGGYEVAHISSPDGGKSWSSPNSVSAEMPESSSQFLVSSTVVLQIDDSGKLHVAWAMYDQEGFGDTLLYSSSVDRGRTWSIPIEIGTKEEGDYSAEWPAMATIGSSDVYLIWVGKGSPPGRSYRFSLDGGKTWSETEPVMDGYRGGNRGLGMVVDSASALHLFSSARVGGDDTAVRHVVMRDAVWGPVTSVDPTYAGQHSVSAVAVAGNHLFVAWEEFVSGEIYLSEGLTDAPAIASVPYPDMPPTPYPSQDLKDLVAPTDLPIFSAQYVRSLSATEPNTQPSQAWSLLLITLPVAVLVTIVVVAQIRRR